ncbi:MAG: hypothetical protein KGL39_46635, partial [Patescibacteria group bacterium]|nr:hypothetical protein [Patescibacteria group bacterium]
EVAIQIAENLAIPRGIMVQSAAYYKDSPKLFEVLFQGGLSEEPQKATFAMMNAARSNSIWYMIKLKPDTIDLQNAFIAAAMKGHIEALQLLRHWGCSDSKLLETAHRHAKGQGKDRARRCIEHWIKNPEDKLVPPGIKMRAQPCLSCGIPYQAIEATTHRCALQQKPLFDKNASPIIIFNVEDK